jgi:peptide/nickel transport system substrate-binding protein
MKAALRFTRVALALMALGAVSLWTNGVGSAAATGTVKISIGDPCGETNSLDPVNQPGNECSVMVNQVYNRLLDKDSAFQVHPELAESFSHNADATQWTFRLRKGVKFHDGHELTSKDVVWTFKRLLDPASKSEGAAQLAFLDPNGITGPDPYTVIFKLPKPVAELPGLITIKNTWIIPDGKTEAELKLKGDGTGPFMAVNFQPKQTPHVFVRNPNYWESGRPKADRLEFYTIAENNTTTAAIRSGQVDLAEQVDFASIPALQKDPNIKLLKSGPSTTLLLVMWTDTPPYKDIRVRQAFKKVIDRKKIVDTIWLGYGVIGDDNPIQPVSPYAWRKQVPPRDVQGAKKLLTEAGYGPNKPLKVDLYTTDNLPGKVQIAQLFKAMAADAGVQVNVIVGPASEYWDNVWLKQPFVVSAHVARPPAEAIGLSFRSNSKYPETHWFHKDFDALLGKAVTTVDDAQRLKLYKQLEQIISERGGDVFEGAYFTVAALRKNCSGYVPHVQIARFDTRDLTCTK